MTNPSPLRADAPRKLAKAKTRQTVQDAAKMLFEKDGYEATTIRDIATAAGMSTGAVFANFENKADLYAQIYGHPPVSTEMGRALLLEAKRLHDCAKTGALTSFDFTEFTALINEAMGPGAL